MVAGEGTQVESPLATGMIAAAKVEKNAGTQGDMLAATEKQVRATPEIVGGSSSDEGTRSLSEEEELDKEGDGGINIHHTEETTDATEPSSSSSPPIANASKDPIISSVASPPPATAIKDQILTSDVNENVTTCPGMPASDNATLSSYELYLKLNASINASLGGKKSSTDTAHGAKTDVGSLDIRAMLGMGDTADTAFSTSCRSLGRSKQQQRGVRFVNVCIREYDITIGDNPYCSHGVPICLDWNHGEESTIPIDFYEASHKRRRTARRMLLNSFQRRDMLWRSGYRLEDIESAIKENDREKFRRSLTLYFLPIFQVQEILSSGAEKCFKSKKSDAQQLERTVQKQQMSYVQKKKHTEDTEVGGMSIVHQYESEHDKPARRLSFRSDTSSRRGGNMNNSFNDGWSVRSGSGYSDLSHDRDDPYAASSNSRFREYSVRVDRGQHDKATEIILCNNQRPHMRSFHMAWVSFFVAFFMWFAITPLLSEVKATLNLSKSDIWTSSLCGTAGTIIMRILIGPACDKFGARLCMAFILTASAIPCALTGLVETAQGLYIVRTFVGIAGSSFVACQYWTSQMFAREVAGTANALVAGWGNFGGGVTQVVMGSVLFPLFELIFSYENEDDPHDGTNSSELAWRTVFVIPTLLSLFTAYVIVYHADDSPKGDYRERVRQQEIMVVSPMASLCAAAQNWNVWILLIQYAACFGVEVTMTNATALYFKDEFGQTTVSAAAIASVFGTMNLFARGLGGFGSDLFNAKYGMRGRMIWQAVTLFLEGAAVVIFGYADTLPGSIIALIFLSLMVQSAEGSTFGIVPYVDRRFTGSVVGWVGAGGNIGGACFSVLFIKYDYERAFALMGLLAAASSVLSCFMNVKKLTSNAETLAIGRDEKMDDDFSENQPFDMGPETRIEFAQLDDQDV